MKSRNSKNQLLFKKRMHFHLKVSEMMIHNQKSNKKNNPKNLNKKKMR